MRRKMKTSCSTTCCFLEKDYGSGTVENHLLGRISETGIVYACGRTDLMAKDALRLDHDDAGLCILGKQTAWELSVRKMLMDLEFIMEKMIILSQMFPGKSIAFL